jgi:hypothetical protein
MSNYALDRPMRTKTAIDDNDFDIQLRLAGDDHKERVLILSRLVANLRLKIKQMKTQFETLEEQSQEERVKMEIISINKKLVLQKNQGKEGKDKPKKKAKAKAEHKESWSPRKIKNTYTNEKAQTATKGSKSPRQMRMNYDFSPMISEPIYPETPPNM